MADYEYRSYRPNWIKASEAAVYKALGTTADSIVNIAKRGCPIFLGNLRRAIARTEVHEADSKQQTEIGIAEGNADAFKYALAVERGRQAGKKAPPVKALLDWVRRKLHVGQTSSRSSKTGRISWRNSRRRSARGAGGFTEGDWAVWDAAFLIARAIGRRGIPARPFLLPAFDQEKKKLAARVKKNLAENLKEFGIPDAYSPRPSPA